MLLSHGLQLLARLPAIDDSPSHRFSSKKDIIERGMRSGEHEVLVNHSDSLRDGLPGRFPSTWLAIDQNVSRIRLIHSIEQIHSGTLARAIFADDSMDAATLDLKVDARIGHHLSEPLCDPAQFDG